MIAEAMKDYKALVDEARKVQQITVGDRAYTDKELKPLKEPLSDIIKVRTLSGFADLIKAQVEAFKAEQFLIHIEDQKTVILKARTADKWGRRLEIIKATNEEENRFQFGQHLDHEAFIIGLQANFTSEGDRDYLLRIAANLTAEVVTNSEDDGISQKVGLKAGVTLKSTEILRPRVELAPFRTFREADQPKSEFLFRVKQSGEGKVPTCALFEADGGAWKIAAMQNIAFWLKGKVPDDLPIAF